MQDAFFFLFSFFFLRKLMQDVKLILKGFFFFFLHVNNKLDNFYVLIKVLDNKYFLKNYLLYACVYLFTCVHTLVYNIFISCDLL